MRNIHKPLFTIGLLTFVTPFIGLPEDMRLIIMSVYGIAVMILVSTIKEPVGDSKEEPTYEEITAEVQEEMGVEESEENEDEEDQKDE